MSNIVIPGKGTIIGTCDTANGTFVTVAQVQSFSGPTIALAMEDATGVESEVEEKLPTIAGNGEIGMQVLFNPNLTNHLDIKGYVRNATLRYIKITFPNPVGVGATAPGSPKTISGAGYFTKCEISGANAKGLLTAALAFQPAGDLTYS